MCCTKHCSNGVPGLVLSDMSQQRRPVGGPVARRAINVHAETSREEPTRTSVACKRHVARHRHERRVNACRSLGAQSCCLLLATDLVNGPTIKAKPNSEVIHDAVRRLSNTKRGAAKGKNTFPFPLHYSLCRIQREKQKRIKNPPGSVFDMGFDCRKLHGRMDPEANGPLKKKKYI